MDLMLHAWDGSATEVVGQVEGGVKFIAPSPDGALIVIITGFGQIMVMTHDWELLYETAIGDHPKNVDVPSRTIKSFHGSSIGLDANWGKSATAFDRKADKKSPLVIFFERNGLERSSFNVDELMDAKIEVLRWNCSSDLLGAVVRCEKYDAIIIWSFSNNHWYLKQEIRYPNRDRVKFIWDPLNPLHLISWTSVGKITTYNFVWMTAVMENSVALVTDNSNVLITPFALSFMPPPMYLFNLKFPSSVRDITVFSKSSKNQIAACLSDGSLCIVELPPETWEELEGKEFYVETSSEVEFGSLKHLIWLDSHILLGVSYCESGDSNTCLVTSSCEDGLSNNQGKCMDGYSLQEIEIVCSEDCVPGLVASSGWGAKVSCLLSLEGQVIGIAPNPAKRGSAFVQLDGGRIVEYTSKLGITGAPAEPYQPYRQKLDYGIGFSSSCPWMSVASVYDNEIVKPLPFGLHDNGRLHVKNLGYLTEFVCSIKNENVTETLYRNVITLPCLKTTKDIQVGNVNGFNANSKISSVLQAIQRALDDQVPESPARELGILTTLARSEPPSIEEALKRIKVIREMELLGVDDPRRKSYPSAEEALKHLLWLTDYEAVYEAALGLHDLNLAAIVALNSQKDPKEFVPFLQGLERLPPQIMKYTVDLRLQGYESALKSVVLAGDPYYEDSINLMKINPQLFPLGLQLFTDPFKRLQILEAWGDHLHGEKCFEDAVTAYFLCCSSLAKAPKAYRACGNWKGVLTVAGFLKFGKEEVLRLANEL
ncbi:hypothetical protein NE237_008373 [Protea cynaroides]|uniref:Elongator complex protein 1 n=1 Tax=Protea cynaroides TaxID=273540 RepID=A0A9Q0QZA6_9MAGN|nr:hypothetical protein NE237_008373 [Protea cynaroides]